MDGHWRFVCPTLVNKIKDIRGVYVTLSNFFFALLFYYVKGIYILMRDLKLFENKYIFFRVYCRIFSYLILFLFYIVFFSMKKMKLF